MSKAVFKLPPTAQPATNIDDWVAGHGTGTRSPAEKTARLTIDLPMSLHARFKSACALRGTRMVDEVREFIEKRVQQPS